MTEAEKERAAIVEWLKRQQHRNKKMSSKGSRQTKEAHLAFATALKTAAHSIESGDHLK